MSMMAESELPGMTLADALAAARKYDTTIEYRSMSGDRCRVFPSGEVQALSGAGWRCIICPGTVHGVGPAHQRGSRQRGSRYATRRRTPPLTELERASAMHCSIFNCAVCAARISAARESLLPVKKGVHDWSGQPRIMVDQPETYEPSTLRHLVTVLGLVLASAFFMGCAVLGGLLLARAVHDAITMGWSWSVVLESISDRLGPA